MLRKLIHTLMLRRHFWRHATFSEVAELYASRMLRVLALNMSAAFTSIYLYQIGYSILFIALLWAAFYVYKALACIPMAALVARIGPKHAILLANILYIPALIALALLPEFGMLFIVPLVLFQASSATLYQIAYMVDFSRVKSIDHAGKEIAYMNILEKITTGLSPLIGGILAFIAGPQIVILIAAVLFAVAALPLFSSAEQELPRQKLQLRHLPWHLVRPNIAAEAGVGFDVFASGTMWTLFVAIVLIGVSESNDVYIANGILLSVVLVSALLSSYVYGRLIDGRRGRELLRIASLAKALTHVARPFTGNVVGAAGLNVANEAVTTGYVMAFTRGNFDNADLSGQRAAYIGVIELIANVGAAVAAGIVALLALAFAETKALEYFFYIAAAVVLLIATARFPLYRT